MSRILYTLFATATLILAQDNAAAPLAASPAASNVVIRIVDVKQADPAALAKTLETVLGGIAVIRADAGKRVLIVRGTADTVAMVEDAIKRLDVAPAPPIEAAPVPNVELTVQLLYGSLKDGQSDSVPQDLAGTVKQLHALFPYKSYRVMESFLLRGLSGGNNAGFPRFQTSGTLPGSSGTYSFSYQPFVNPGPAPRTVRINDLRFALRLPVETPAVAGGVPASVKQVQYTDSGIQTSLDAREGQKTVVGKSNLSGTEDALILVVTPVVIQ